MRNARTTRRRGVTVGLAAALTLLVALIVAGCGGGGSSSGSSTGTSEETSGGSSGGAKLSVVGYSTPESVYAETLEPAFEKTPEGNGVSFSNSFGASGDQSRAVVAGQPASVVHFSTGSDLERLVEEGELVSKDWNKNQYKGIATDSLVVILVEKGNPLGINSFKDLEENEEAEVVTPNPFSSGSARWNIMAVYGSAIEEGASEAEALEAVKTVLEKTTAQPGSGRDAFSAFSQGEGNVLLTYENEAIKAEKEGEEVEYVIPPYTMKIETPIAVTKEAPEPQAEDFLKWMWSDEGQELWAENGYRPVNPKLVDPKEFPEPSKGSFDIAKFGGWAKVKDEFFDEEEGSVAKIEQELGVSTSG
ncbi:MAG TPA: extracellular solute-binding protein [Solirubrobacterales bacterium]|jgi:sulfate transport system substrate-binding protein|nr:extracellular solute-binding protein [Solirubrobacterales bacterium]